MGEFMKFLFLGISVALAVFLLFDCSTEITQRDRLFLEKLGIGKPL
jgi:hypothetical protein